MPPLRGYQSSTQRRADAWRFSALLKTPEPVDNTTVVMTMISMFCRAHGPASLPSISVAFSFASSNQLPKPMSLDTAFVGQARGHKVRNRLCEASGGTEVIEVKPVIRLTVLASPAAKAVAIRSPAHLRFGLVLFEFLIQSGAAQFRTSPSQLRYLSHLLSGTNRHGIAALFGLGSDARRARPVVGLADRTSRDFNPAAFDLAGLPLGTVWQKNWARENIGTTLTKQEKTRKRKQAPIEEKESVRWVEGIRAAREVAEACPQTTCVCVGDSESDIYEFFSEPRSTNQGEVHLLVRVGQTRATIDQSNWLEEVRSTACLYTCTVNVSARTAKMAIKTSKRQLSRDARVADVEVRASTVTLRPPKRPGRKLPEVTVNVVLVEETKPPEECEPIQWLLVTTLPINDPEQVKTIVQAYCIR